VFPVCESMFCPMQSFWNFPLLQGTYWTERSVWNATLPNHAPALTGIPSLCENVLVQFYWTCPPSRERSYHILYSNYLWKANLPNHVPVVTGVTSLCKHALCPVPVLLELSLHPGTELLISLAHTLIYEFWKNIRWIF
jgi:hypothetical protein